MSELNKSEPVNLDDVIKTSQERIDSLKAESAPSPQSPSPKRGRGRPVGWRKVKAQAESNSGGANQSPHGSATVNPQIMRNFEISPLASEVVKLPFDFIGASQGVDLTPTDDEAKTPANYLAKLIDAYMPSLDQRDPKTFNLIAFLISYALLAIKKVRIFVGFKNKNKPKEENKDTQSEETLLPQMRPIPTETTSARDFFSGGRGI